MLNNAVDCVRKCLQFSKLLLVVSYFISNMFFSVAYANDYVGHYYLQGVTEVGSELLIKQDGSFEWTMSYGAMDEYSSGKWSVQGKKLVLVAARQNTGNPGTKIFNKLELEMVGKDLVPVKPLSGRYVKS